MMLQIKFGCNRPAGLGDIHVWKCGRMDARTDAHTDGRTDAGSSPILWVHLVSLRLRWAINLIEVWILYIFFNDFIHAYSPRAGADTHWGQHFDVNRKALSFCPFNASFKKIPLQSDFIHIFSCFYTCKYIQERGRQPLGDKILMSKERPYHFAHLLQVFSCFYTCI